MSGTKLHTGVFITLLTLLVAGCGTTPDNNYYVLTAQQTTPPTGQVPAVGIGPIQIPEYLNRTALVYQREGNQLQIARYERWAEPLEDGIARILGLNLAGLLDTENIRRYPWQRDQRPDYAVRANLLALDADEHRAQLVAEWQVIEVATGTTTAQRITRLEQPLADMEPLAPMLPGAYSELLHRLSIEIATAIPTGESEAQVAQ